MLKETIGDSNTLKVDEELTVPHRFETSNQTVYSPTELYVTLRGFNEVLEAGKPPEKSHCILVNDSRQESTAALGLITALSQKSAMLLTDNMGGEDTVIVSE